MGYTDSESSKSEPQETARSQITSTPTPFRLTHGCIHYPSIGFSSIILTVALIISGHLWFGLLAGLMSFLIGTFLLQGQIDYDRREIEEAVRQRGGKLKSMEQDPYGVTRHAGGRVYRIEYESKESELITLRCTVSPRHRVYWNDRLSSEDSN